jgi:hypothetical protein
MMKLQQDDAPPDLACQMRDATAFASLCREFEVNQAGDSIMYKPMKS